MTAVSPDQSNYGQLRVAFDDDVHYYALAPEATLVDVSSVFTTALDDGLARLCSVRVMIVTEPRRSMADR